MTNKIPSILYKYRTFNVNSLDSLIRDKVWMADPASFNDPFDCQPSIVADLQDVTKLIEITCSLMFETQVREVITRKDYIMDFLEYKHDSLRKSKQGILGIDESSTLLKTNEILKSNKNDYVRFRDYQIEKLRIDIKNNLENLGDAYSLVDENLTIEVFEDLIKSELLLSRNVGVLSLAKKNDCPLMWAHYAADHQGFCCGYRLPGDPAIFANVNELKEVNYDGDRTIKTSQLHELIHNSTTVKNIVNNAIYYVKSKKWKYEKEYRMIGKPGLQDSPFILDSIYFGLRCDEIVKFTIVSSLANRLCPVNFYQMEEVKGSFDLKPKRIKEADLKNLLKTNVK